MAHPFGKPSTETRESMMVRLGEIEWSEKFLAQPNQTQLTNLLHKFAESADFAHYMEHATAQDAFRSWLQYNK